MNDVFFFLFFVSFFFSVEHSLVTENVVDSLVSRKYAISFSEDGKKKIYIRDL